jgi:hypothetical protein
MSAVEKKSSARPKEERRHETVAGWAVDGGDPYLPAPIDITGDVPVDWVANHEIALPADARIFRPEALSAVAAGRFERRHARNITAYLEGHERVLDIGVGIGFIPIRSIKMTEKLIILAHDYRADLIALAAEIARRASAENSARLKWAGGPLRLPGNTGAEAGGLAAYLHDFRPSALRISRAADVPAALLAAQDLKTLRRVLVPFASDEQAAELRAGYGPVLGAMGFAETPERAAAGSLQFDRVQT